MSKILTLEMETNSVGQLKVEAGDLILRERCWGIKWGPCVKGGKTYDIF